MLPEKVYHNMMLFWDTNRMETNFKELTQALKTKL